MIGGSFASGADVRFLPIADIGVIRQYATMSIVLRPIATDDLPVIANYDFTVSISESLTSRGILEQRFAETGFWQDHAGARAIEVNGGLVGTCQFYRAAPCIHGYELGYIVHDREMRGSGYGGEALRLLTELVMADRPHCYRLQLIIEVWKHGIVEGGRAVRIGSRGRATKRRLW